MKKTLILSDDDIQGRILAGLEKLSDAVAQTLGPRGQLVLIDRNTMFPMATKDGATVAKEIESSDPVENMAISVCKETALRTEEEAGDGTTSSIIMAEALVRNGFWALKNFDISFFQLKDELEKAAEKTIEDLKLLSESGETLTEEDIKNVIRVSSNYDEELVDCISKAIEGTGRHGTVLVEDAKGLDTSIDVVSGFSFDKGLISPYFMTHPQTEECKYDNPRVLIYKARLDAMGPLLPILQDTANAGKSLFILCDEISPEVLTWLVVNKMQHGLKICVAHPPHHGDRRWAVFEDLAKLTGASIIDAHTTELMSLDSLGTARGVICSKKRTVFLASPHTEVAVEDHIKLIAKRLAEEKSKFMQDALRERISRLTGGIGVLRIGAPTELEMREKKARAVDAHLAAASALEEGVVPGGGVTWVALSHGLEKSSSVGANVLKEALLAPFDTLCINACLQPLLALEQYQQGMGYNGRTGKYEDLRAAGIIDPTKVLINVIKNSVSIAKVLLNVGAVVHYSENEDIKQMMESN